eukprot:1956474-Rhodomonas_salina.2
MGRGQNCVLTHGYGATRTVALTHGYGAIRRWSAQFSTTPLSSSTSKWTPVTCMLLGDTRYRDSTS